MRSLLAERLNSKPKRSKTKQTKNQSQPKSRNLFSCDKQTQNQAKSNTSKEDSIENDQCHKQAVNANRQQQQTIRIDQNMPIPINIILVGDAERIKQTGTNAESNQDKEVTIKQIFEDIFNKSGRFRSNKGSDPPRTPNHKKQQTKAKGHDDELKIENIINHISGIFIKKDNNKANSHDHQHGHGCKTKRVKIGNTKIVLKVLLTLSMHEIIYGKYTQHIDAWRSLAGPKLFVFLCHSTNTVDMQLIHKFIKDVQYLYRPNTLNAQMVKNINNKNNTCNASNTSINSNTDNNITCSNNINIHDNNALYTSNIKNVVIENGKITYSTVGYSSTENSDTNICNLVTGIIIVDRPHKQRMHQLFTRQAEGQEMAYVGVEDGLELASKYNLLYIDTSIDRIDRNGCADVLLMMSMFKINQIGLASTAIDKYMDSMDKYMHQQSHTLGIAYTSPCPNSTKAQYKQNKLAAQIDQLYHQSNTVMDSIIQYMLQVHEHISSLIQYDTAIRYQANIHIHGRITQSLQQASYDRLRNTIQQKIEYKLDVLKHVKILAMLYPRASNKSKIKIHKILSIYAESVCAQVGMGIGQQLGMEDMRQLLENVGRELSYRQDIISSSRNSINKEYSQAKKQITSLIDQHISGKHNSSSSMVEKFGVHLSDRMERVANLHIQTYKSKVAQHNITDTSNNDSIDANTVLYIERVIMQQLGSIILSANMDNSSRDGNSNANELDRASRLSQSLHSIVSSTLSYTHDLHQLLTQIQCMITVRLNLFDKIKQLNNYSAIIIDEIVAITQHHQHECQATDSRDKRSKCNTISSIAQTNAHGYYMLQSNTIGINKEVNQQYLHGFLTEYYLHNHYEALLQAHPKQHQPRINMNISVTNDCDTSQLLKSNIEFDRSETGKQASKFISVVMQSQYTLYMSQYKQDHTDNKHINGFDKSFIDSYKKNITQLRKSTKKQQFSTEENQLLHKLQQCLQQYKLSVAQPLQVAQEFKIRASKYTLAKHMYKLLKCTRATRVAQLLYLQAQHQHQSQKDRKKNKYMWMSKKQTKQAKQTSKTNKDKSRNKNKNDRHAKDSTYDQSGGVFAFTSGGISLKSQAINIFPSTLCNRAANCSQVLDVAKEDNTNSELEVQDFSFSFDYLF